MKATEILKKLITDPTAVRSASDEELETVLLTAIARSVFDAQDELTRRMEDRTEGLCDLCQRRAEDPMCDNPDRHALAWMRGEITAFNDELERRIREAEEKPNELLSWEEVKKKLEERRASHPLSDDDAAAERVAIATQVLEAIATIATIEGLDLEELERELDREESE